MNQVLSNHLGLKSLQSGFDESKVVSEKDISFKANPPRVLNEEKINCYLYSELVDVQLSFFIIISVLFGAGKAGGRNEETTA